VIASVQPFGRVAPYYDVLYRSKSYEREAEAITSAISRWSLVPVRSLLDVGCGTGRHLRALSRQGWQLTGLDTSKAMLEVARKNLNGPTAPTLIQADAAQFNLGHQFDAATCLFAAFSYLLDDDARLALACIRRHLYPGSVLVLDVWHAPAVLAQGPSTRRTEVAEGDLRIIRTADGCLDRATGTVRVHYQLTVYQGGRVVENASEDHVLRYFFPDVLDGLLQDAGFEVVTRGAFPDLDVPVSEATWNAGVVARATARPPR
jgi:SAM-dependent methyltransferase